MSQQSKLFDRAADCDRLKNLTSDQYERLTLKIMRDLWTALANESGVSERVLLSEIAELDKLQLGLESKTQFATLADEIDQQQSLREMPDVKILESD